MILKTQTLMEVAEQLRKHNNWAKNISPADCQPHYRITKHHKDTDVRILRFVKWDPRHILEALDNCRSEVLIGYQIANILSKNPTIKIKTNATTLQIAYIFAGANRCRIENSKVTVTKEILPIQGHQWLTNYSNSTTNCVRCLNSLNKIVSTNHEEL